MALPSIDFSSAQQGLRDLGAAVDYRKRLQDERDATTAQLGVMSQFNDKMRAIQRSGDYSEDWGTLGRKAAEDSIDAQEKAFHDADAFATFKANQLAHFEQQVPQLRAAFDTASSKYDSQTLANIGQEANDTAGTDLTRAAAMLNTGWGANVTVETTEQDETAGAVVAKRVRFGGVAMNAYRRDGAAATAGYRDAVDGVAESYVKTQVGKIADSGGSYAEQAAALTAFSDRAFTDIENSGLHVSTVQREKLKASLDSELARVQKAAIQENKDRGFGELAARVSAISAAWTDAKLRGNGFDPVAALKPMLLDKSLDTDVRKAVNEKIKEYTLEADKTGTDKKKVLDANLLYAKNLIQTYLDHGASTDFIQGKINSWLSQGPSNGGLAVDNYAALKEFADNAPKLAADPILTGIAESSFKGLPDDGQRRLKVRLAELAGGLYAGGDPNAYKDPSTGRWQVEKLQKAASAMAEAEKTDVLKKILTSNWFGKETVVENDELVQYVTKAGNGELVGQFSDPGSAVQRAAKFTDAAWWDLVGQKKDLPKDAKGNLIRPQARINVYTKAGLPTFVWDDGSTATPSAKNGKLDWNFTKTAPADALEGLK